MPPRNTSPCNGAPTRMPPRNTSPCRGAPCGRPVLGLPHAAEHAERYGNANTYRALPLSAVKISGLRLAAIARNSPSPVGTATYCVPPAS